MKGFLDHAPVAIGNGYQVSFRFAHGQMEAAWEPHVPPRMQGQMLRRYRGARNDFLQALSAEIGAPITCLEA